MQVIKFSAFILLATCLLSACNSKQTFTIEGVIQDAGGETVYLEQRGFTSTSVVDSAKISQDGSFKIKSVRPDYPELYVLKLGDQSINLAVDSIEDIQLQASKNNFATDYVLQGSDASSRMKDVVLAKANFTNRYEKLKSQYDTKVISGDEFLASFQNELNTYKDLAKKTIFADLKSPAAYFTLFQKFNDGLIIDPYHKDDSKLYSAVATSWDLYYKENPRSKHLHDFTLQSISARKKSETSLNIEEVPEASSSSYYAIELPDMHNNLVALSSLKGKVTLLDFTSYQAEFSPTHNLLLNKVYQKHKNKLNIYQVSFDPDMHAWQNSAINIPWIAVRNSDLTNSALAVKFNLQQLPTTFILNSDGIIIKKLMPGDNIEAELNKLL